MSSFESNKIFAAILVAGITAMFGAFLGEALMHPHELEQDAVAIEGGPVETASGGAAATPEPILHLIASADITKGEKLSKACAACHSFDQGGVNKIGPNLWGIVGAKKAHISGFDYSAGMLEKGGAWDYASLNHFLWKPKAFIDGTKMNFVGLKKPEDRAAMIAWLRTLGSSMPMPSAAQIAAEAAELGSPEADEPTNPDMPAATSSH